MQNHNGSRRSGTQRSQHLWEVHPQGLGIVVGVSFNRKTSLCEQGSVVFPTGVADQHFGLGVEAFEKICANLEPACATQALHRGDLLGLDRCRIGPKNQGLNGCVVGGNAVNGQIAAGRGLVHHGLFGFLNTGQQGQFSVVIVINAHAKIDFLGIGIQRKLFVQAQNWVARCHFDGGKHRHEVSLQEGWIWMTQPDVGYEVSP